MFYFRDIIYPFVAPKVMLKNSRFSYPFEQRILSFTTLFYFMF